MGRIRHRPLVCFAYVLVVDGFGARAHSGLRACVRCAEDVLKHSFLKPINWQILEARQVTMPFVPTIKNPLDTSNFEEVRAARPEPQPPAPTNPLPALHTPTPTPDTLQNPIHLLFAPPTPTPMHNLSLTRPPTLTNYPHNRTLPTPNRTFNPNRTLISQPSA